MSLPHYFQDLSILHINTTPHHAYFIPHATHKSAVENPREYSDYFISLNNYNLNYIQKSQTVLFLLTKFCLIFVLIKQSL